MNFVHFEKTSAENKVIDHRRAKKIEERKFDYSKIDPI